MPIIEKTNLTHNKSARLVQSIPLAQHPISVPATRATTRRTSYFKMLLLFILVVGIMIFLGNVYLQPTIPTMKVQPQMPPVINANLFAPLKDREANIKRSKDMFEEMSKREESKIQTPRIGPAASLLYDPVHIGKPFLKIEDTSKCYGFNELERASKTVLHSHLSDEERSAVSSQFSVVPRCLKTGDIYHFGWEMTCHVSIPKAKYFEMNKRLMWALLSIAESAKRMQAEEAAFHIVE